MKKQIFRFKPSASKAATTAADTCAASDDLEAANEKILAKIADAKLKERERAEEKERQDREEAEKQRLAEEQRRAELESHKSTPEYIKRQKEEARLDKAREQAREMNLHRMQREEKERPWHV